MLGVYKNGTFSSTKFEEPSNSKWAKWVVGIYWIKYVTTRVNHRYSEKAKWYFNEWYWRPWIGPYQGRSLIGEKFKINVRRGERLLYVNIRIIVGDRGHLHEENAFRNCFSSPSLLWNKCRCSWWELIGFNNWN